MTHLRAFTLLILGVATCSLACSEPAGGDGSCFDGETGQCFCSGGDKGARVCRAGGFGEANWGECDCSGGPANNGNNGNNGANNGANNGNNGANNGNNGANNGNNGNNGANNGNNGVDPDAEPPVIDELETSATTLRPSETTTLTARVSDPQGAHTIFGGMLIDTDAGATVGAFALASPGVWEATLGWPELAAAEPIEFGAGGEQVRHLQVVFQDLSGNEATAALELTLRCDDELEAATGAECAPPRGPAITTFTATPSEIRPGDRLALFARVDPDPDNPNGSLSAVARFGSDEIGPLNRDTAVTFTGTWTWAQLNAVRAFDTTDLDRGDRRSIQITVTDNRGLRASASANLTAHCADPLELPVGGVCVGECSDDYDYCARFGLYGAKCLPNDRCWWLADASTPPRSSTCNSLCERIDLRCDDEIGFPDGYSGVRERCYGSPGCYAADQRRLCATPTRSGETSRLACVCVR